MADVAVPSIATGTPIAGDHVLGDQGGVVKRFPASPPFAQLAATTGANLLGYSAAEVYDANTVGAAIKAIGTGGGSGDALVANPLSQFAATTSLQLKGVISDETGSGALVFATSPTLVTPALGTPASGVATNLTGTASGLTAGNVTTNANLTGDVTSVGNAATVVKINGTSLAGLATGILKNTTTTGVPSIAAAGTDYVAPSTTVNGHALSANVTVTASDVSLGSVTNDAQTKAAIVPNTAPAAGKILVGNAGGTAYAPASLSADATLASTGALTIVNSAVTLAKIANAAASSALLGSGATGSGAAYTELTLGTNLSMSGTTLNAAGGSFSGALGANNLTGTGTANRIGTAGTNDANADWMFTASGSTKRAVTFQGSRAFGNADALLAITDFGGSGTALAIDSAGQIVTNSIKATLTNLSVTQSSVIGWSGVNSAQGTQVGTAVLSLANSGSGASRKIVIANDTSTIGAMIENSGGRQRVTADVTNATTTFSAITGLGFNAAASGKYTGRLVIKCNDSVAAEGIKFDFNGGTATVTSFWAFATQPGGGTTVAGTLIATTLAGAMNWSTITGETLIVIEFSVVVNAAGTVIPRFAQNSHSTGTATAELGSFMWTESTPL